VGCDIDPGMVQWVDENLDYMTAVLTGPKPPLPFSDNEFDAIVSISVFTHLNEKNQDKFLWELSKITEEGGYLFITNHGSRALERAKNEEMIFKMLNIDKLSFERACHEFEKNQHAFIPQHKKYNLRPSLQDREKAKPPKGIGKRFREIAKRSQYRLWGAEEDFEYGITFIPGSYIVKHWAKWFDVIEIIQGAIHDFQDIIVLSPKKRKRKLLFLKG
jgi:SAM-dependent methyltransferase